MEMTVRDSVPDVLHRIRDAGVLAVLRAKSPESAIEAAEAIIRGNVMGIEVTYSTPDAPAVVRELVARHGDRVCVGAGTITSQGQAEAAADAGAAFLVSPGTQPELTAAMKATGRVVMTGAFTPTEMMVALGLGVDVVKLFPASLGGPAYLKALRAPFPEVPVMPTGGVNPQNLAEWFACGAVAVGAGGDLAGPEAIVAADWQGIEHRAASFSAALRSFRAAGTRLK